MAELSHFCVVPLSFCVVLDCIDGSCKLQSDSMACVVRVKTVKDSNETPLAATRDHTAAEDKDGTEVDEDWCADKAVVTDTQA